MLKKINRSEFPKIKKRIEKVLKYNPWIPEVEVLFNDKKALDVLPAEGEFSLKEVKLLLKDLSLVSLRVDPGLNRSKNLSALKEGILGLRRVPYVEEVGSLSEEKEEPASQGEEGESFISGIVDEYLHEPLAFDLDQVPPPKKLPIAEECDKILEEGTDSMFPLGDAIEALYGEEGEDTLSILYEQFLEARSPELAAIEHLDQKIPLALETMNLPGFLERNDVNFFIHELSPPPDPKFFKESEGGGSKRRVAISSYMEVMEALLNLSVEEIEEAIEEIKMVMPGSLPIIRQVSGLWDLYKKALSLKTGREPSFGVEFIQNSKGVAVKVLEYVEPPSQDIDSEDLIYLPEGFDREDLKERIAGIYESESFSSFMSSIKTRIDLGLMLDSDLEPHILKKDFPSPMDYMSTWVDDNFNKFEMKSMTPEQRFFNQTNANIENGWYRFQEICREEGFLSKEELETWEGFAHEWIEGSGHEGSHYLHGFFSGMGVKGSLAPGDLDHLQGMDMRHEGITYSEDGEPEGEYILDELAYPLSFEDSGELRNALMTVYAYGQAVFKSLGIKSLILYRGVKIGEESAHEGDIVRVQSRELSSWSTKPSISYMFGEIIVKASIPVERVFSYNMNGPFNEEREAIVIGSSEIRGVVVATNRMPIV